MSLIFSAVGSGDLATNWANGAGEGGENLAWGIIVDRNGNGLTSTYATTGVNYGTATGTGQSLLDGSGVETDDILFMSPVAMLTVKPSWDGVDGAVAGQNAISAIVSVPFLTGVETGDTFYLAWFDVDLGSNAAAASGVPLVGDAYGIFGHASFVVPGEGFTVSYSSAFDGADALKLMTHTWSSGTAAAPEPTTAALALLGAAGLLRRRRR